MTHKIVTFSTPAALADFDSASVTVQAMIADARRASVSDDPVLISGEVGVGKEHLARAIHREGPRRHSPFVAVDCSAVPEEPRHLDSTAREHIAMFDPARLHRRWFEEARGGTLFLDGVGELPRAVQAALLRTLAGSSSTSCAERAVVVDARLMAAIDGDPARAVEHGLLVRELHHRLAVVELNLSPLRDRPQDISRLTAARLDFLSRRLGRPDLHLHPDALALLQRYHWHGNVRQLFDVIDRAVRMATGCEIEIGDVRGFVPAFEASASADDVGPMFSEPWLARPWAEVRADLLRDGERAYLDRLLREARGRIGVAARRAGLAPRSLFEKMRRHGLQKERYRQRP